MCDTTGARDDCRFPQLLWQVPAAPPSTPQLLGGADFFRRLFFQELPNTYPERPSEFMDRQLIRSASFLQTDNRLFAYPGFLCQLHLF